MSDRTLIQDAIATLTREIETRRAANAAKTSRSQREAGWVAGVEYALLVLNTNHGVRALPATPEQGDGLRERIEALIVEHSSGEVDLRGGSRFNSGIPVTDLRAALATPAPDREP